MITKFKIFEDVSQEKPEVGDYVILKNEWRDKIYKILEYRPDEKYFSYIIDMKGSNGNFCCASVEDFEFWSKNKEDLIPFF